ncbi:MAG: hypothetical protein PUD59_03070 [bacterium]|nr:hypothetical protein [bacterium]
MTSRTEKNKKVRKKIIREEKKEIRRTKILKLFKKLTIFFIVTMSILFYVYYVSTSSLTIREYSKSYDKLPSEMHGYKIIQFGDLYYDNNYKKMLDILVENINKVKPDLVVFTGNLVNHNYKLTKNDKKIIQESLKKIKSTTGKYFVTGQTDTETSIEILNNGEFKYLDNSIEEIYYNSTIPIILTGIIDKYDFDYSKYKNNLQIVLINNPDNIENIKNNHDIIMSGKNINSQIRLPYFGALINRNNKYINSYYMKNNIDIYITGGIGTNNYPIRLFNHPSINFYRLRAK